MTMKKVVVTLAIAIFFGALLFALWGAVELRRSDMGWTFADQETRELLRIAENAENGDADQTAEMLVYLLYRFPSENARRSGPREDRVMARVRLLAIGHILETLRRKTGEDFGEDPEVWIEEMKKRSSDGEAETNPREKVEAALES